MLQKNLYLLLHFIDKYIYMEKIIKKLDNIVEDNWKRISKNMFNNILSMNSNYDK